MTSTEEDQFPVGLRVLLVDDDPTCLRLIENLLKKCSYNVTTTNRAKDALRILKDNKKKFDIVISDVEMPDMDGIKLLQLVGLDMNIPVIMLSSYSDTKRVMQGVRNGACDYLVKPVRIQELQNIWQHVVRRKKAMQGAGGTGSAAGGTGKGKAAAAAAAASRDVIQTDSKGKGVQGSSGGDHHNENDDDEDGGTDDGSDEGGRDNDESTAPKKQRLLWNIELHQKFVDAVNQLGPDKAFPKKILDLMDVEGLTREKVASHLQKYRIYLRKMSTGSVQSPGNRFGVFGAEDAHIGSLGGGYGVYRSLAGPGRFPGLASLPDQPGSMLGRLNSAAGLSLRGISSSPMLQTPQLPNSGNSFKFEPLSSPGIQNSDSSMFPPTMQMNKASLFSPPNTPMMFSGNAPLPTREFSNQSSLIPSSSIPASLGIGSTPNLLDPPVQPTLHSLPFSQNMLPPNVSTDGIAPPNSQIQTDPLELFSGISSLDDSNRNAHSQDYLSALSNFSNSGHSQIWPDQKQDYRLNPGNISSSSTGLLTANAPTAAENARKSNASPFSLLEGASSQPLQQNEVQKSNNNENILLDDPKLLCGSGQSSSEYLEDIVGRFLQQGNGDTAKARDDLGLDPFLMQ